MSASETGRLVPAAVAIPVLESHGREPHVLLTRRPTTLSHHPGEICFPGGKVDPGDSSHLAAACRELEEELGVSSGLIHSYRQEPGCSTTSGFFIEPFVLRLAPEAEIRPNEREIDAYGAVALSALTSLDRYRIEKFSRSRDDFGFTFPTELGRVRGATCSLLLGFVKAVLRAGSYEAYSATFSILASV